MNNTCFVMALLGTLISCHPETITQSSRANDTFYVENAGAAMRVTVRGNTTSRNFMLVVHGGPGGTSYFYRTDAFKTILESEVAVVYWDQRSAGASQGGTIGKLTVDQYADDLKKVVQTILYRYGAGSRIYLMSHSWGGLLTSAFMTKGTNQQLVKGWLFVNATHNYPLNDQLTRQKLIQFGQQQIALSKNTAQWQRIVDYSQRIQPPFTLEQEKRLNDDAYTAMTLIEGFTPLDEDAIFLKSLIPERVPYTSSFSNLIATSRSGLPASLVNASFSTALSRVTVPVLDCAGQYDFVCPKELGDDFLASVGSANKRQLVFAHTGHNLEEQTDYARAFLIFIRENQ